MSKRRKKKKYQLRKKSKNASVAGVPRVSEAVNKRDEKKIFRIAIIVTVILLIIMFLIFQNIA